VAGAGVVSGTDFALAPGESVFVFVNSAASVTLVGEALIGTQTVPIAVGNNFIASKIPIAGTFTELGLSPGDGGTVNTWTGTGYQTYDYVDGVGYIQLPEPTVAVGQGLVANALTASTWTKTFTPAP
jgi:ribosomal protein L2